MACEGILGTRKRRILYLVSSAFLCAYPLVECLFDILQHLPVNAVNTERAEVLDWLRPFADKPFIEAFNSFHVGFLCKDKIIYPCDFQVGGFPVEVVDE